MSFLETLNAAIADMIEHGFDSEERLQHWLRELQRAARGALIPEHKLREAVVANLNQTYGREVKKLLNAQIGGRYGLGNIQPRLHEELKRRILASANLITLNRDASIARTLQRFAGWASSVPKGGTNVADRREVKKIVRRAIGGLPFEERRVIIDQGHKLVASINEIVAVDGGAIAARWRHVRRGPPEYQSRPQHVARDGHIFLVRDSWAHKKRLVKSSADGYTDQVEQPAELPYCSCHWDFLYGIRNLPPDMITAKGNESLTDSMRGVISA